MLPLVIVAGPRALPVAALATAHYAAAGIAATVVRPVACAAQDAALAPGTRVLDDESLPGVAKVRTFLDSRRGELHAFGRTPGWYLQQFLKLAAVAAIDAELVLVTDGDTIFSAKLLNALATRPRVLTTGERFANYDRLVTALGLAPAPRSCVANGGLMSAAPPLRELASADRFVEVIRDQVLASSGAEDFSEYQLAGSVLAPVLGERRIRLFRRFDLLLRDVSDIPRARIDAALRRYDAVAIEIDHLRSPVKRAAARLMYALGRSW